MNGLLASAGRLEIFRILFSAQLAVPSSAQHLTMTTLTAIAKFIIVIIFVILVIVMIFSQSWFFFHDDQEDMRGVTCQAIPLRWFGIPRRTNSFTFGSQILQFEILHI